MMVRLSVAGTVFFTGIGCELITSRYPSSVQFEKHDNRMALKGAQGSEYTNMLTDRASVAYAAPSAAALRRIRCAFNSLLPSPFLIEGEEGVRGGLEP